MPASGCRASRACTSLGCQHARHAIAGRQDDRRAALLSDTGAYRWDRRTAPDTERSPALSGHQWEKMVLQERIEFYTT